MITETLTAPPAAARRAGWWAAKGGYLAAGWAALYGVLALIWTITGDGYPFGPNDDGGDVSLLRLVPAEVAAPVFAATLLVTAVLALAMAGRHAVRVRGGFRLALLAFGWLVAAGLLLVVPDVEVLALAGYAPMLILSLPFGGLPVDYAEVFTWALLNKGIALAGGLLVARAVWTWQLRSRGACESCGRGPATRTWTSAASATRWGRWAAWTAAAIPVVYATTRLAWLAGIPLGASQDMVDDLHDSGGVWAGTGLAAFALVGAVLTLSLTQRWGEVFPRWTPWLAGKPVPVKLAVVPATFVAIAVAAASLGFFATPRFVELMGDLNSAAAPMLLWPLWAVALGLAALAYHLRRRGTCPVCART